MQKRIQQATKDAQRDFRNGEYCVGRYAEWADGILMDQIYGAVWTYLGARPLLEEGGIKHV